MPGTILTTYRAQLAELAQAWLLAGATSFALQMNGAPPAVWPAGRPLPAAPMRAEISMPERPLGALLVGGLQSEVWQAQLNADARMLSALLAVEDELNTMTGQLVGSRDQLLAVFDLTGATRDLVQINQLLDVLTTETAHLISAKGSFYIVDPPGRGIVTHQYPQPLVANKNLLAYLRMVQDQQEPLILENSRETDGAPGWQNLLLVPIKIQGRIIAALGLMDKVDGPFTTADIKLGRAVGEHAGAHLEKWLLYEQHLEASRLHTELELATAIQTSLLPERPPAIPGLDLWGETRSALQVGGDFYDFIYDAADTFTFTAGDVSGKGLSASLLMATARIMLRTSANRAPSPSPSAIIRSCNELLYSDFAGANRFVTVFVGQYQPASRRLQFASAGHAPVVYCPRGAAPRLLEADSMPVGIVSQSLARSHQLLLDPGDVLVVATDGLTEARNEDDRQFGHDRLMSTIKSLSTGSAHAIAAGVYNAVNEFSCNAPREDDQTILVLKVCEPWQ